MENIETLDSEKKEMTDTLTADDAKTKMELDRSRVRRVVTYGTIMAYLLLSAGVIAVLMWNGRYDLGISVLGGVGGIAGSISGFWFGARKPKE